uniref:Odorant receptor n=1 Tax=Lutzomyia longipalpis TaxID=7200 RepID=A0A240SXU6_LUTLO
MAHNVGSDQFERIVNILNFFKGILSFNLSQKLNEKFRKFLVLIPALMGIICVLCSVMGSIGSDGDVVIFAFATILVISVSQVAVKIVSLFLYEVRIDKILQWFRSLYCTDENDINSQIFTNNLRKTEKIVDLVVRIFLYSFGLSLIILLFHINMGHKLFLILPFIPKEYFLLHTIGGTILLLYNIISLIITECTMMLIGIYFIGALSILSEIIKKLNESSNIPSAGKLLRSIITLHIEILTNFNEFCDIFYFIFTIQLFTSVLLLLGIFYLLLQTMAVLFVSIVGSIYCQFTLFCIFGQIIRGKSERIFTDLYQTKWYEMSIKDQKALLIIMRMSQKGFELRACGMYDIDFMMLVNVSKMCFSYCTILYALL